MKGYRVILGKGERSIRLFKHPKREHYQIWATNEEKTQKIAFSGEAMAALVAMMERYTHGTRSYATPLTVEPYTEPPQYHWVVVTPKKPKGKP